jgi:Plasma-membrane choline transporter
VVGTTTTHLFCRLKGSICLGSLIVAIVSATKEMLRQMRDSGDNMIACCAEFVLSCIARVIEYFNEWAFCFVGIYGYSFMESGMEVMNLLKNRGWTSIIAGKLMVGLSCLTACRTLL